MRRAASSSAGRRTIVRQSADQYNCPDWSEELFKSRWHPYMNEGCRMLRLAVLIDAENVASPFAPAILAKARSAGQLNVVRLFGDFTEQRLSGWLDIARAQGHDTRLQLSGGRSKNSTDIALAIDAMDILYAGAVDGFVLVSDDRDFIPLAGRLRAAGKRVYVICLKPDDRLASICSEVFVLRPPAKAPAARPAAKSPPNPAVAEPPIVAAFRSITRGTAEIGLAEVSKALRTHRPDLIASTAQGAVRKALRASGRFEEVGEGSALRIRLKG